MRRRRPVSSSPMSPGIRVRVRSRVALTLPARLTRRPACHARAAALAPLSPGPSRSLRLPQQGGVGGGGYAWGWGVCARGWPVGEHARPGRRGAGAGCWTAWPRVRERCLTLHGGCPHRRLRDSVPSSFPRVLGRDVLPC